MFLLGCTDPGPPADDDDDSTPDEPTPEPNILPDPIGEMRTISYVFRLPPAMPVDGFVSQTWAGDIRFTTGGGAQVSWRVVYDPADDSPLIDCPVTGNGTWDGADGEHGSTGSVDVEAELYPLDCDDRAVQDDADGRQEAAVAELGEFLVLNADDVPEDWEPSGGAWSTFAEHRAQYEGSPFGAPITHAILVDAPSIAPPTPGIEPWALFAFMHPVPN